MLYPFPPPHFHHTHRQKGGGTNFHNSKPPRLYPPNTFCHTHVTLTENSYQTKSLSPCFGSPHSHLWDFPAAHFILYLGDEDRRRPRPPFSLSLCFLHSVCANVFVLSSLLSPLSLPFNELSLFAHFFCSVAGKFSEVHLVSVPFLARFQGRSGLSPCLLD